MWITVIDGVQTQHAKKKAACRAVVQRTGPEPWSVTIIGTVHEGSAARPPISNNQIKTACGCGPKQAYERRNRPATAAQIKYLRSLGWDGDTKDLSVRDASDLIDTLRSGNVPDKSGCGDYVTL